MRHWSQLDALPVKRNRSGGLLTAVPEIERLDLLCVIKWASSHLSSLEVVVFRAL